MNIYTKNDAQWITRLAAGRLIEVSKYPVTNFDYSYFIRAGGYQREELWSKQGWEWISNCGFKFPAYWGNDGYVDPKLPVTGVSFWEAEAYAAWAGGRLPTETEWADICSNNNMFRYPWGGKSPTSTHCNLAYFGEFSHSQRVPVDSFPDGCSHDDIFDLLGNVSEWCVLDTEQQEGTIALAVLKGGCCWHTPLIVDCRFRDVVHANTRDNQTGVRVFRDKINSANTENAIKPKKEEIFNESQQKQKPLKRLTRPFRQEGIPGNQEFDNWRLKITGLVQNQLDLSIVDLKNQFSIVSQKGIFVCVCRWADFNYIEGVLVQDVIKKAGVNAAEGGNLYLVQKSIAVNGKRYITSVRLQQAIENNALLCFSLDGAPLTKDLGSPLRYVDFSLYGYKQVKALNEIEVTSKRVVGWWEDEKQYDIEGVIQPGYVTLVGDRPAKLEIL